MNGVSPKQMALDANNELPEDASLEAALQRPYVIMAGEHARASQPWPPVRSTRWSHRC